MYFSSVILYSDPLYLIPLKSTDLVLVTVIPDPRAVVPDLAYLVTTLSTLFAISLVSKIVI